MQRPHDERLARVAAALPIAGFIDKRFWYVPPGMQRVGAANGFLEYLRAPGGFARRTVVRDRREARR
jgi:hypothetical protein